jgi:hypothetical protein
MSAPETLLLDRIKTVFDTEFAPQSFVLSRDRLLRADGKDGTAKTGMYPTTTQEDTRNANMLVVGAVVQLYLPFNPDPAANEHAVVDPTTIIGYADRFRRAIGAGGNDVGNVTDFWYLRVPRIDYPVDPSGNVTRFEAQVEGRCDNPGIYA